jgi:geranyl-CoA carboxylase alpha subunit
VVHLGERDCSVQRRHQKVVEEAPCPVMTPALREAMGGAAVEAARSIDYRGAGTVEFLLDAGGDFYFLEMNTRLQVEHPVTEMITGLDLVALQFRVAQGYPLGITQEEVSLQGHAIEVRLYAEDTGNDFLPATGTAMVWETPTGEGIRVDHGLQQGQDISPFYDPMIAKIIAWGEDRETARRRLLRALEKTVVFGVQTNRQFLLDVLRRPAFVDGAATTGFIAGNFSAAELVPPEPGADMAALASVIQYRRQQQAVAGDLFATAEGNWAWRSNCPVPAHCRYTVSAQPLDIYLNEPAKGQYRVALAEHTAELVHLEATSGHSDIFLLDGVRREVWHAATGRGELLLQCGGNAARFVDLLATDAGVGGAAGSGTVHAPMHGNLLSLAVAEGDEVAEGQLLAVMEAMKMEHRLLAEIAGKVVSLHVAVGQQVAAGAVLLEIADD